MRLSDNTTFMDELHRYYAVWQEFNFVYEEWAKAHSLSVNSLFVLSTIYEGGEDCTQKKISQKWLIPKQRGRTTPAPFFQNFGKWNYS